MTRIADGSYRLISHRQRLWAKALLRGVAGYLSQPGEARLETLRQILGAHPWSRAVRGGPSRVPAGKPPRLMMLMLPCCWDDFTIPFVQLGEALRRRGIDVHYWGGHAGFCSFFGSAGDGEWTDHHCRRRFEVVQHRFLGGQRAYGVLNDEVTSAAREDARAWVDAHLTVPVLELTCEGRNVFEYVKSGAARWQGAPPEVGPHTTLGEMPEWRPFVEGLHVAIRSAAALLDRERPDALMVFSGYSYQERVFVELARERGIRVIAQENSCFANRRIFDTTGMIGNRTSLTHQSWPRVRDRELSRDQERMLDDYLGHIWSGRINKIAQAQTAGKDEILGQLNLDGRRPMALLIGQVPIDTVILHDLNVFDSSLSFILAVIEYFRRRPDWDLVVRLHPLEARTNGNQTWHRLQQTDRPENVRIVEGMSVNTYALMDLARIGITSTSQAGIEMLAKGNPLVVVGDAFYAGKDFTHDIRSREAFEPTLDSALENPRFDEHRQTLVRRFLHHMIFEHQVEYDPVNQLFPPSAVGRIEAMVRSGRMFEWDAG